VSLLEGTYGPMTLRWRDVLDWAAEATAANNSVTKMDPADANWSGIARTSGTGGTSGAMLDGGTMFVRIAATPPAQENWECKLYGVNGTKMPTVVAGTANGVKLMWTGTAGGVNASFAIHFIAD
jgi:expansin (peptidoglycan-binding protein)